MSVTARLLDLRVIMKCSSYAESSGHSGVKARAARRYFLQLRNRH